jgi:hypothetical protein
MVGAAGLVEPCFVEDGGVVVAGAAVVGGTVRLSGLP